MRFGEAIQRLEQNDEALVFLDEDLDIHHIEENDGRITWYEGSSGYDEPTSLEMLHAVCEAEGKKFVDKSAVPQEIEKLVKGEWETVEEWQES